MQVLEGGTRFKGSLSIVDRLIYDGGYLGLESNLKSMPSSGESLLKFQTRKITNGH